MGAIVLAAGLFMALTRMYAQFIHPRPRNPYRQVERVQLERRPAEPDLGRFPNLLGHGVLFGLITIGGRKLLRLRLTDRPSKSESA